MTSDLLSAVAEDLVLYREKFRRRLPKSPDELHGPPQGDSGAATSRGLVGDDLVRPGQAPPAHGPVPHLLHKGLCDDPPRNLDRDVFLQLWPVLRTLVGRTVREDAFPRLASCTLVAA